MVSLVLLVLLVLLVSPVSPVSLVSLVSLVLREGAVALLGMVKMVVGASGGQRAGNGAICRNEE